MSVQFQPLSGCLASATAMQTTLVNSMLRLFKSSFVPSPSNALADYIAAEADYDNYVPKQIAAWNNPLLAPGSGYQIISPLEQFNVGLVNPVVGNLIGGCFLVDDQNRLRLTVIFTQAVPMQLAGQGIPITLTELFSTGV